MTPQPPPDLLKPERPVRSFDDHERVYARRRIVTITVLALIIGGGCYAMWGRGPSVPAEIPTIKAEGTYRQKPADPGGISIPHQDVRVYDELEGKDALPPEAEHLLPPPEVPQPVVHDMPVAPSAQQPAAPSPPAVDPVMALQGGTTPVETTVAAPPVPQSAPMPIAVVPAAPVAMPTPAPVAVAPKPPDPAPAPTPTIEQVIADTKSSASGGTVVQLASVPDKDKAQALMQQMQNQYSAQLGGVTLRLARADLGSRGVYYRIQSQGLGESQASQLCSRLKQMNLGCILVRK